MGRTAVSRMLPIPGSIRHVKLLFFVNGSEEKQLHGPGILNPLWVKFQLKPQLLHLFFLTVLLEVSFVCLFFRLGSRLCKFDVGFPIRVMGDCVRL